MIHHLSRVAEGCPREQKHKHDLTESQRSTTHQEPLDMENWRLSVNMSAHWQGRRHSNRNRQCHGVDSMRKRMRWRTAGNIGIHHPNFSGWSLQVRKIRKLPHAATFPVMLPFPRLFRRPTTTTKPRHGHIALVRCHGYVWRTAGQHSAGSSSLPLVRKTQETL